MPLLDAARGYEWSHHKGRQLNISHADCIRLLVAAGASPNAVDKVNLHRIYCPSDLFRCGQRQQGF